MTFVNLPVNATIAVSGIAALLQTAPPADLSGIVGPVERLTLVMALVIAVRVLWVSNQKKDEQIIAMAKQVTETMANEMAAVKELRKATEELGAAMDNVAENVAALASIKPQQK